MYFTEAPEDVRKQIARVAKKLGYKGKYKVGVVVDSLFGDNPMGSHPNAMATSNADNPGQVGIFLNQAMVESPEDYREVVLAHEIAHLALGHVTRETIPTPEEQRQAEFDADAWAAKAGFDIVGALWAAVSENPTHMRESTPDHPSMVERLARLGALKAGKAAA